MEKFNLNTWLQDKSRKVVTRDGREVRIVCWDLPGEYKIIGVTDESDNGYTILNKKIDGTGETSNITDLFFADEEEELTEFEKGLNYFLRDWIQRKDDYRTVEEATKESSKKLLDLARKELEKNYYTKVLDDRMVLKSELHATDVQTAYDMGKQDALKDLPKWKKANEYKEFEINEACSLDDDIYPIIVTNVNKGEYYLELDELRNLPLEK